MTLVKSAPKHDLSKTSLDELTKAFQKCHDDIWEGGKRDPITAFDEISKLLVTKIFDEKTTRAGEEYGFQVKSSDTTHTVIKRIEGLYLQVKKDNPSIFKTDIKLPSTIVLSVVKYIQNISFLATDLDVKGRVFENFLGKIFRDEYGQYFTPRNVVKFMVELLDPGKKDIILDPACGSGGFLLHSMEHIINKAGNKTDVSFAQKNINGIEINDRIARIAMMDMIIHGDGHSNIECNNSLLDYKEISERLYFKPDNYSIILTNPPFGSMIKDSKILNSFTLSNESVSQKSEILFIERCIEFLKTGGRLGIVLPDSILKNSSLQYVRDFILKKAKLLAVVSLPQHAFVPSGAGVKSSLLFIEKGPVGKKHYKVFMATTQHIGYDSRGEEDTNELDMILADWNKYKSGHSEFEKSFLVDDKEITQNFSPDKFIVYSNYKSWSKVALSELCDGQIFTGRTPARKQYTQDGYKILKVRDTTGKGIDWDNTERGFVSPELFEKNRAHQLQENDIFFITAAHHPKYIGLKVDILDSIPKRFSKGVLCSAEMLVVRVNPKKIDPYYVLMFFKSQDGYNVIQSCIRGQTAHIYPKDIKNIEIPIPPQNMYKKIQAELNKLRITSIEKSEITEKYVQSVNKLAALLKLE